jgi:hypothetical protein
LFPPDIYSIKFPLKFLISEYFIPDLQISKKNEPQKPPVSAEGPGRLTENMPKITVHVRTDKVIKSSPVQEEVKTTPTQEEAKLE